MRNDLKLIEILSNRLDRENKTGSLTGLCGAINSLYFMDIISVFEKDRLHEIIKASAPLHVAYEHIEEYWWKQGRYKPRRKFLSKLLKQYKWCSCDLYPDVEGECPYCGLKKK